MAFFLSIYQMCIILHDFEKPILVLSKINFKLNISQSKIPELSRCQLLKLLEEEKSMLSH